MNFKDLLIFDQHRVTKFKIFTFLFLSLNETTQFTLLFCYVPNCEGSKLLLLIKDKLTSPSSYMYINRRAQDPWVREEGCLLQHKQWPEQHHVLVPPPQSPDWDDDVMRVRPYLCTQWEYIVRKEPQIGKPWAKRNCRALLLFSPLGRERFIILESKQMSPGCLRGGTCLNLSRWSHSL